MKLEDRERRQRELYLERAAEDSLDAIVSLDTEGNIRYWNRGAERMFGYPASEALGSPYEMLVPAELKAEGELERIAEILDRQGGLRNFETVRRARDGRHVTVDITVSRLTDDGGAVLGRCVIYRDISLRRRLQAENQENMQRLEALKAELSRKVDELRKANHTLRRNQKKLLTMEKLSAVGEMAAKVAHEIRNPLVTIGGFSHTLYKSMPPEAKERQYVEIIRDEVKRLEVIVSDILDYVKPGAVETQPCQINELVRDVLRAREESMRAEGVELALRLEEGLPPVDVNRFQIHQVLSNLVLNALQAMAPSPGSAEAGRSGPTQRLTVSTGKGENHVLISVGDTGPGIPDRQRERIFQPFFTTKPGGSGLGLAIAAQIVAQHHATLAFTSADGAGTTFHLRLPIRREVAAVEDDTGG